MSMMQDLIIGNIISAEIEAHGNNRGIHDHFLCKQETIIANTVLVGSLGSKFGAELSPLICNIGPNMYFVHLNYDVFLF